MSPKLKSHEKRNVTNRNGFVLNKAGFVITITELVLKKIRYQK